ncbi:hypothetical protein CoHVHLJ_074 [Columbid alphaherpesvirus 1]|uniref:Uncharacterized protein n=1 Tax=Columbid alphaherpesvirus 1 TaxID=93386 RepID=A0A1V0M8K9_9ALPH|nr:hypothetical protein CoHVHLJ_074 [Columbid alphaherpesvirus 1]ARD71385.1 hypothetical protein CoHVHLJ_074 [Columbid alphaherpesvirus 1]
MMSSPAYQTAMRRPPFRVISGRASPGITRTIPAPKRIFDGEAPSASKTCVPHVPIPDGIARAETRGTRSAGPRHTCAFSNTGRELWNGTFSGWKKSVFWRSMRFITSSRITDKTPRMVTRDAQRDARLWDLEYTPSPRSRLDPVPPISSNPALDDYRHVLPRPRPPARYCRCCVIKASISVTDLFCKINNLL